MTCLGEAYAIRSFPGGRIAVHGQFQALSGVDHGFSLRPAAGAGAAPPPPPALEAAFEAAGFAGLRAATLRQVHGSAVAIRSPLDCPVPPADSAPAADAQATLSDEVVLVVRSADCVPLLIADPSTGAVAAGHAGWRGTREGVAVRLVDALVDRLGGDPRRMTALIGPAIGGCCYEVGPEVAAQFDGAFVREAAAGPADPRPGVERCLLDLPGANADQLRRQGLAPGRIIQSGLCTACRGDLFPSYRVEGPRAGRIWSLIARRRPTPR